MKDIPIIFELVIVGFEVLAWILLLALTLFGYQWIELNFVTQWATQLSFGLLGLAYMFGAIFEGGVVTAFRLDRRARCSRRDSRSAKSAADANGSAGEASRGLQPTSTAHQSTPASAWDCF